MSQTSLLPKIKIMGKEGKHSYIPLTHNVYATQRVGRVVPYMAKWTDADGKHKINLETLNYMAPMISPTVGDVRFKHWLYYVPLEKMSKIFANMFAKQKAVNYNAQEFDVTSVPNIGLHYLTALCLIGSFCTIYFKQKDNNPASPPYKDGAAYLYPTNWYMSGQQKIDDIEGAWNAITQVGDFVNRGTVAAGDEGKTVIAKYAHNLLGGLTSYTINAKYLFPSNNIVTDSATTSHIDIPLANPTYDSFFNWLDSSGKPVYDGKHLDQTHGIDCSPVSLKTADYTVTRSATYTDPLNGNVTDYSFIFAFRFSDFGRALRDCIIASGDQLNVASIKPVSFLPFLATYMAYFYCQPLQKYKNFQNTACYKIIRRFETNNITNMSINVLNLNNNATDPRLFVEFINDLASMWAISPQDFVSSHSREPITSPLLLNSLDSFLNSVSEDVKDQTNPPSVPITNPSGSVNEPSNVSGNNIPYIDQVKHDVVVQSLISRITQRMATASIIGRPIAKLAKLFGFGEWQDDKPNLVDYGELRLNLKPVVSTSDTSNGDGRGADLGQLGGRGYGHKYHESKAYYVDKPGYFVLLTTVVVNSGYCQAIDASNYCVNVDDFYRRDLDAMGFEVNPKSLVHGSLTWVEDGDQGKLDDPFGYSPRSTKFKVISNKLLGEFTDGERQEVLSAYHLEKLLPIGKRSLNEVKDVEIVSGYHFTRVELGSRFAPADTPISGNIWRYIGRFPWMGQFDRIFKQYDYDVRKIQGVFGLDSDNFFELVSKYYAYFISTPENYTFLNTLHYDSWQDKKPISESFGTLSEIFQGGSNMTAKKA